MQQAHINQPLVGNIGSAVAQTIEKKHPIHIPQVWERQLQELYLIEHPEFIGQDKPTLFASAHFEEYTESKKATKQIIYYPWINTSLMSVDASDYFQLITNRNRDLVTADEQIRLYQTKVAVFGLSVGSNIAYTLAQSGISQEITLADYDDLDTTNLNRLPAGLHQVGLNKAVIAARRIYENNPYTKVNLLEKGISIEHLETLLKEKQIDFIFEEIDNLKLKLDIRKLARTYHVPVLMITDNADGVVLHIERYDLGYEKFFGKDDIYWDKKLSEIKSIVDVGELILNSIIGGEANVHPRVHTSVKKVLEKQLISWSQLGTAATLGGVVSTIALKNILLDNDTREYVHECINIKI